MQIQEETIDSENIADFIAQERIKRRWSRIDLGYFANVDHQTILHYENRVVAHPKFDTVNKLLSALGYEIIIRKKKVEDEGEDSIQRIL